MAYSNPYFLRFTYLLIVILSFEQPALSQEAKCADAPLLVEKISQQHVNPPTINSEIFKKRVLTNFVREMDPLAIYFSKADADKIISFALKLENEQSNVCDLISEASVILKRLVTEYKVFLNNALSKPFDFNSKESFSLSLRNKTFAEKPLLDKERIRWLKLQLLIRLHQEVDSVENNNLLANEKTAREKILTRSLKDIDHLISDPALFERKVTKDFFKALTYSCDPHTEFFSSNEMNEFRTSLSSKKLSWGFDIGEDKLGQAVVSDIVPGGAAWNSNSVHNEDVILGVNVGEGQQMKSIDFSPDQLNKKLQENLGKKVTLTIKRKDGKLDTIKLEKTEMDSDENNVKSFILKGSKNIGYISLPAFYTDWNDPRSKGCANDVAKELVKLKKENIQGLILDLRFNGGGLVNEAVDLAGIFIDFGPMMILKAKEQPAMVLKDINRGVAYDGPLIVLINGFSASASELVAAALQDYKRAIIVGSPSFGKSTSQTFLPVVGKKDTLGFLKITFEKVYRISGKSHQLQGVVPDIQLPDFTNVFGYNERSFETALPADSIVKKVYYTSLASLPLNELRTKSEKRQDASNSFQKIKKDRDSFSSIVPLDLDGFLAYMAKSENDYFYKVQNKDQSTYKVVTNKFDNAILQIDSYSKEINDARLEEIESSPYIDECYKILADYINSKINKK